MLELFTRNLLPVFLAAGAGYLLAWRLRVDPQPLARVVFHVFVPCLVFHGMTNTAIPAVDAARMIVFACATLLVLAAVAWGVGRAFGWSRTLTAAVVLVVFLPNAANYGLSVIGFALGDEGVAHATLFYVTSAVLTFTVGVFVASLGRASLGRSMAGLLRVPAVWAVVAALAVSGTGASVPAPVARTVGLVAGACIPAMLVLLGMQLQGRGVHGPRLPLVVACLLRLVGGCFMGFALAGPIGLEGVARQAAILETSMPSAVITLVLATEYDVEPAFVTGVVFVTTMASPLTLTPLMRLLGV